MLLSSASKRLNNAQKTSETAVYCTVFQAHKTAKGTHNLFLISNVFCDKVVILEREFHIFQVVYLYNVPALLTSL